MKLNFGAWVFEFGAWVRLTATAERITGVIERVDGGLHLVALRAQDHGEVPIEDSRRWPGERVSDGREPWEAGTFSLVRRFPVREESGEFSLEGIFTSQSWRTEGQRHPGRSSGYYDDGEPATFEQWRRVPVYWVALPTNGKLTRPVIVAALPDDVEEIL
jgi:hypothetical protein